MKKWTSLLVLTVLLAASCSDPAKTPSSAGNAVTAETPVQDEDFYKRLEGTIAGQPVVMHLHKSDNSYTGIYYYKNAGQWLTLSVDSTSADSIFLSEYTPGEGWSNEEVVSATLRCKLSETALSGTWISGDKLKSFPVKLEERYPQGAYRFGVERMEDSLVAFPAKKDSPAATTDCSFVTAKQSDWINERIKVMLGFDSTLDFAQGFRRSSQKYFEEYKTNLPEENDTTIPLSTFNYASSQSVYVRYNDNGIVILEGDYYDYSGGAHGNYGSAFYCYDVVEKRKLKLQDILLADSATLQPVVEKYFRVQYQVKEKSLSDVLFDEHLALNDNFYFTEKGIGFLYNPYEVASYAQGQINVFVPFSAVGRYLTPYIRERLKMK